MLEETYGAVLMLRKTITLSEPMEEWIKSQITSGRYASDSEYFRDLIRKDQDKRAAEYQLRALIKDGLDSGVSNKTMTEIKAELHRELSDQ